MKRLTLSTILLCPAIAAACPQCVETVALDAVDKSQAFNGAIWLMVTAALVSVGGVAGVLWQTRPRDASSSPAGRSGPAA